MSHHLSGPRLRSPGDDPRLDLTDVFVFPAPDPTRCVLIMNVNPDAPTGAAAFHPDAVYRLNVDTDGDNRADIAFSFVFSPPRDGAQWVSVFEATGASARSHLPAGERLMSYVPVGFGADAKVTRTGDVTLSAGLRSDPFFADLDGIVHDFRWTGVDAMADRNVFGIVLEVPNARLGPQPAIGVWARVSVHRDGALVSMDRGAHPSLTAYFNADDAKDAYNRGEPVDDWDTYRASWAAALRRTGGYTEEAAERALGGVLPDILRYDRREPAAYPNGRTLTDDVTSARLAMVTNGKVTTDHIGPHTDLLPGFPYLGDPHPVHAGALA